MAPYNFLQRSVLEKRNESDSSRISHGAISGGRHGDVLFVREECKDRSQPRGIPQQRSGQVLPLSWGLDRGFLLKSIHPYRSTPPLPPRLDTVEIQTRSGNGRSICPLLLAFPLSFPYLSNCTLLVSPLPPHRGANVTRTFKRINGMRREEGKKERRNRSVVFLKRYLFLKKKRNSSLPS